MDDSLKETTHGINFQQQQPELRGEVMSTLKLTNFVQLLLYILAKALLAHQLTNRHLVHHFSNLLAAELIVPLSKACQEYLA